MNPLRDPYLQDAGYEFAPGRGCWDKIIVDGDGVMLSLRLVVHPGHDNVLLAEAVGAALRENTPVMVTASRRIVFSDLFLLHELEPSLVESTQKLWRELARDARRAAGFLKDGPPEIKPTPQSAAVKQPDIFGWLD